MAIVTASEVAALSDDLQAADITAAGVIGRAEVALARHCGYPPASVGAAPTMEAATYTVYTGDPGVWRESGRELILEPFPVISITSIHDDPNEDYDASSEVSSSDWSQRGRHGERIVLKTSATHGGWSSADRAVRVILSAGYATPDDDLKMAVIVLCDHWMRLRQSAGYASLAVDGMSTSFRTEKFPDRVLQLIGRFRLPSVYTR